MEQAHLSMLPLENFETLSVELIFITEMARTALKSSHLSSLVNIKSAFLPVRSGLTKSFAEDQRVLHHALVWQWEGSTQTLLSHRQYFFNFFIRNIRDISTLMITRVAANFQGILIDGFGKHKERGDPTFSLRYEWKDEFGIVSQRFESSRLVIGLKWTSDQRNTHFGSHGYAISLFEVVATEWK